MSAKEKELTAMKRSTKQWGDPMSYSDVETAKFSLRKPNKAVCVYCLKQAVHPEAIEHKQGCPQLAERC
jgi:hypothetical protein